MKNALPAALLGLFVAACSDPNEPARFVNVPAPEWTKTIDVRNVSKHRCILANAAGEVFRIARAGTDIGQGLVATRDNYDCYVRDQNQTKCNWNSAEHLEWCIQPNPAYAAYRAGKK